MTMENLSKYSEGPWSVTPGMSPDRPGRSIVEDCNGNAVCFISARGAHVSIEIMEDNAQLIAAAPTMLDVLLWLDNEMDCRDDELGAVMFTRDDFERVRHAIARAIVRA